MGAGNSYRRLSSPGLTSRKIANLRQAVQHEPHLEAVHTWNADSNAPMLAVNVAMGFTPLREWGEWELAT